VLYFAENAISAIQGGGIVVYAVLKGLPPDRLLGFFDYRNITPAPEYADRFVYLGPWRTPAPHAAVNRLTGGRTKDLLRGLFAESCIAEDFAFVRQQVERRGFTPDVVYFSGLSYRYLRLAVMAAEHYDLPMVLLHMDDWMQVDREAAGRLGDLWHRRTLEQMSRAAARSLASTTNSPRLAARCSEFTGYRHVPANNCCADLMAFARAPERTAPNRIPVITYAGAMNRTLQGETLKVLASAVTELNAEGTRVHLHIYTPWEFAPEANAIAVPHAVFYKGQVGREQLADIYRKSDFLATTVTYRDQHISLFRHSLSTKLSEYLCMGKPVISMGHRDWHLHEYVQEHGCGFSIPMDGNFSRAAIKTQLQGILATDPAVLADIGRRNRRLWERAHDVTVMATDTRRALRIDAAASGPDRRRGEARVPVAALSRRGVLWLGDQADARWVPAAKVTALARKLVDVFDHTAVDLRGTGVLHHPELGRILGYCHDVGLRPTLVVDEAAALTPEACRLVADGLAFDVRLPFTGADRPADVSAALGRLREAGVPVRLDVSLEDGDTDRPGLAADLAIAGGAAAVAYRAGAPAAGGAAAATPALVAAALCRAIDRLEAAGIETTVRGLPFCLFDEAHRPHVRNRRQDAYDLQVPEVSGAAWSLAPRQRDVAPAFDPPADLIDQTGQRRAAADASLNQPETPARRAICALSIRVPASGVRHCVVWLYGSTPVGLEVARAIHEHPWLSRRVIVAGFLSSPGMCTTDTLHGYPWRPADWIATHPADAVLITSETSRLAIAERLARMGLLDRAVHLYGTAARAHRYERPAASLAHPDVTAFAAADYATRELLLRGASTGHLAPDGPCRACALAAVCDGPPSADNRPDWLVPQGGEPVADPRHYLRRHPQHVAPADRAWATDHPVPRSIGCLALPDWEDREVTAPPDMRQPGAGPERAAPRRGRVIVVAGMQRAASTWLYNAVSLLVSKYYPGQTVFALDETPGRMPDPEMPRPVLTKLGNEVAPLLLETFDTTDTNYVIKTHNYFSLYRRLGDIILISHREPLAALRSWMLRFPDYPEDAHALLGRHLLWKPHGHYDLRYEDVLEDQSAELSRVARVLGLGLGDEELRAVLAEIDARRTAVRPYRHDRWDPVSLFFEGHGARYDKAPVIDVTIEQMRAQYPEFYKAHGY
jgi:glycosyltransferase involved in cell wall biosynthesis